jgi:hypothetical protein
MKLAQFQILNSGGRKTVGVKQQLERLNHFGKCKITASCLLKNIVVRPAG